MIPQDNGINPLIVESIVRDLAASDPLQLIPGQYGVSDTHCRYCKAIGQVKDKPKHMDDCLWLRARKTVGDS